MHRCSIPTLEQFI